MSLSFMFLLTAEHEARDVSVNTTTRTFKRLPRLSTLAVFYQTTLVYPSWFYNERNGLLVTTP